MMRNLLDAEEWEYLAKHFHLRENESFQLGSTIPAVDLLDEDTCREYLDQMTEHIQSPSRKVTASLLAKRYAFLTVAPSLYAMTMYNKGLDMSASNCQLVLSAKPGDSWLSQIGLRSLAASSPQEAGLSRSKWREHVLKDLFAGHLAPIWRSISNAAHIPMLLLWENTAVRLFSVYEKRMQAEGGCGIQEHIRDDFMYVAEKAPGAVFGEESNPFLAFCGEDDYAAPSNRSARVRKTCCYYYRVAKKEDFCTTCPRASR